MDDPAKVMIVVSVFSSLAYSVRTIANAVVQYRLKSGPRPDDELITSADARLARLEHAVDAIALEIERIAEGQRFTTKLLSERSQPAASNARADLPRAANDAA